MSFLKCFIPDAKMEILLHPSRDQLEGLDETIRLLRGPAEQTSDAAGSSDLLFQLSAALISHSDTDYIKEGITLMESLVFQHWQAERRRIAKEQDVRRNSGLLPTAPVVSEDDLTAAREHSTRSSLLPVYYYYLALGWTKLDDTAKARSSVERLLHMEPQNAQGLALQQYIESRQTREGVIGLAGLTTAVAAAALVFSALKRR